MRAATEISHLGPAVLTILGWLFLCAIAAIAVAAVLGVNVGSEKSAAYYDGLSKEDRIVGLGKITTLYCNYLTLQGLRTISVRDTGTTINGVPMGTRCTW